MKRKLFASSNIDSTRSLTSSEIDRILDFYRDHAEYMMALPGMGTGKDSPPTQSTLIDTMEPRHRFLLKMRGHRFRGKFPFFNDDFTLARMAKQEEVGDFVEVFRDEILIFTTRFFRYPVLMVEFEMHFAREFGTFLATRQGGEKFKIWDIGVGSGEEPVTLSLLIHRVVERHRNQWERKLGIRVEDISDYVEIVAFDRMGLDPNNTDLVAIRNSGRYPKYAQDEIPERERSEFSRHGWITVEEDAVVVSSDIRKVIRYVDGDLFDPLPLGEPFWTERYHMIFAIKCYEYLVTEELDQEILVGGQMWLDRIEAGDQILPGGLYFSDHPKTWRVVVALRLGQMHARLEEQSADLRVPVIPPLPDEVDWLETDFRDPNEEVAIRRAPEKFKRRPDWASRVKKFLGRMLETTLVKRMASVAPSRDLQRLAEIGAPALPGDEIAPDVAELMRGSGMAQNMGPEAARDYAVALSRLPRERRDEIRRRDFDDIKDVFPPDLALELVRVACERTGEPFPEDIPLEGYTFFWMALSNPLIAGTLAQGGMKPADAVRKMAAEGKLDVSGAVPNRPFTYAPLGPIDPWHGEIATMPTRAERLEYLRREIAEWQKHKDSVPKEFIITPAQRQAMLRNPGQNVDLRAVMMSWPVDEAAEIYLRRFEELNPHVRTPNSPAAPHLPPGMELALADLAGPSLAERLEGGAPLPRNVTVRSEVGPGGVRKRYLVDGRPATGKEAKAIRRQHAGPPTTVRKTGPKINRNEPCPCGSGKKFKKCHMG